MCLYETDAGTLRRRAMFCVLFKMIALLHVKLERKLLPVRRYVIQSVSFNRENRPISIGLARCSFIPAYLAFCRLSAKAVADMATMEVF